MKIKATDEWAEDLAMQVTALRIALTTVIAMSPQLTAATRETARHIEGLLLPSKLTDGQIERVRQVLDRLTELPPPPASAT